MSVEKIADSNFETGAVRSADVAHLDFASLPLLGLLAVMRVAGGGGTKYGRFNYMQGMPLHETLNHMAVHLIRYILGDRSEPHLAKVAWGAMVAEQTAVLNPELCEPHMLGPGATLTPAMMEEMERGKAERDAKRQAGDFEDLFAWTLADMPEVQAILAQREPEEGRPVAAVREPWAKVVNQAIKKHVRDYNESNLFWRRCCAQRERSKLTPVFLPAEDTAPAAEPIKTAWGEIHVDPEGSHPLDQEFRKNSKINIAGRGEIEVDDEGFIVLPEKRDSAADRADREVIKKAAQELYENKETLAEWCKRNPMASDAIRADSLGLSATGCPEPFGTLPPERPAVTPHRAAGNPEAFDYNDRPKKITPASEGGDHMGGCPPLP